MKLLYIANIRLPTEKAHGLQIVQNCEAFADAGAQVTLWAARRVNTPELRGVTDIWAHYGVRRNFALRRLPSLDLLPLVAGRADRPAQIIFGIQAATFTLAALLLALVTRADVYYTRDERFAALLAFIKPQRRIIYEAHTLHKGRIGRWAQRRAVRGAGRTWATTAHLADDLRTLAGADVTVGVAHDGIRAERFANAPSQAEARAALRWDASAFVVGYVGRLQTMGMDKGVGLLVDALTAPELRGAALALVGGPDDAAQRLRERWTERGGDAARFLYAGQVPPDAVPLYLSACDACAMPFPFTEHFAYYASPIKLFEYLAAGRAVVASDLPSAAEVVTDGETALLFPPDDLPALTAALVRLRDDPALRERLGERGRALALARYTWAARARMILAALA